jgi:hypothetical protein
VLLSGKAPFAEEIVGSKERDDRLLALFRYDRDLDLSSLNEEDRIGRLTLGKNDLALAVPPNAPAIADMREKRFRIEWPSGFWRHNAPSMPRGLGRNHSTL